MSPDPRRRVGALGERYAETHLSRAGYRVLGRNFRTRAGELDLVLVGDGCLVFCEVRARVGTPATAVCDSLVSIGPDKRRRVRHMAREWLAVPGERPGRDTSEIRFDAVGVTIAADGALLALEHVKDAF